MATATAAAPSREDFAAMLEESFTQGGLMEGSVVKGIVVGIEKDLAVIDVGAKTEGRVALREFTGPGVAARSRSATKSRFTWSASRMRSAKPFSRATRRAARKAGASSRRLSTATRR
jgi:hypothetical protein